RLDREGIQRSAGDPAFLQRSRQGALIYERAAGGVDEVSRLPHLSQLRFANKPAILRGQRRMQREEVALEKQLVERNKSNAESFCFGNRLHIVRDQPHVKARRPARHGTANPSATENAERLAKDIISPDPAPDSVGHVEMTDVHATGGREKKGEGKIRDRFVEHSGCVSHHDARPSRRGHVNGIIATPQREMILSVAAAEDSRTAAVNRSMLARTPSTSGRSFSNSS